LANIWRFIIENFLAWVCHLRDDYYYELGLRTMLKRSVGALQVKKKT